MVSTYWTCRRLAGEPCCQGQRIGLYHQPDSRHRRRFSRRLACWTDGMVSRRHIWHTDSIGHRSDCSAVDCRDGYSPPRGVLKKKSGCPTAEVETTTHLYRFRKSTRHRTTMQAPPPSQNEALHPASPGYAQHKACDTPRH